MSWNIDILLNRTHYSLFVGGDLDIKSVYNNVAVRQGTSICLTRSTVLTPLLNMDTSYDTLEQCHQD